MSDDLIRRLSAGERWNGDNAEVLKALGWEQLSGNEWSNPEDGYWRAPMPRMLDSVDDGLRLVPEGWTVLYISQNTAQTIWWCRLVPANDADDETVVTGLAPTAAVALTIAILEASRG